MLLAGMANLALAAGNAPMTVSAVVPSKSNCKFGAGALTLPFGSIDPASLANAPASASVSFTCNGNAALATFSITAGNGLYSTGPGLRRMRHATILTEYLPYAISLSPVSATVPKGSAQTLTVTGTIQPFEFQNVAAGAYQDTVVITLAP
jgi:spore coat protein U-like protein